MNGSFGPDCGCYIDRHRRVYGGIARVMKADWFYEYDGKKFGPVPGSTLRHLAAHGAILSSTRIWKSCTDHPVNASRVSGLLPAHVTPMLTVQSSAVHLAMTNLLAAMEACRDEDDDRLTSHIPPIHAIHPFAISHVLVDYRLVSMIELPVPLIDPLLPASKTAKPITRLFSAIVEVSICDRPRQRTPLAEIRRLRPDLRIVTIEYEGKEFDDGEWLFLDRNLARG